MNGKVEEMGIAKYVQELGAIITDVREEADRTAAQFRNHGPKWALEADKALSQIREATGTAREAAILARAETEAISELKATLEADIPEIQVLEQAFSSLTMTGLSSRDICVLTECTISMDECGTDDSCGCSVVRETHRGTGRSAWRLLQGRGTAEAACFNL